MFNQLRLGASLALATTCGIALTSSASAQCASTELRQLGAPDVHAGDELGQSVAIDGTVAVSGAWKESTGVGAAYVHEFIDGAWQPVAKLIPSDGVLGDNFGVSVAISGDTIVVGAYQPFPSEQPGKAYVYVRPAGGWANLLTETAVLSASTGVPNDNFGYDVDIDGDTIVVGSYLFDQGLFVNTGAAFVYERPGSGWATATEDAMLTASDANADDQFGISVAISGDTIAVGADRDSDQFFQAGSAYVFEKPVGGWVSTVQNAKLVASSAVDLDRFGLSVAVEDTTVVVGAWGDDRIAEKAGTAYIYERPGSGWANATESARLTGSDLAAGDHFGWAVDIRDDVIAVGAPSNLFDGDGFGATYLFLKPAGGWVNTSEDAKLEQSNAAHKDDFGLSVAVAAPYTLVGAHWFETGGFSQAGASYVFGGAMDCNGNGILDLCEIVDHSSPDKDGDGMLDECAGAPCPGDLDGDDVVGFTDIVSLLAAWGPCPGCAADLNGDDAVTFDDLVAMLASWGPC